MSLSSPVRTFRSGTSKCIYVEKDHLIKGQPAIVVQQEGRPAYRFRRVLIVDGPAVIEQRDGTAYLYCDGEVEGMKRDED